MLMWHTGPFSSLIRIMSMISILLICVITLVIIYYSLSLIKTLCVTWKTVENWLAHVQELWGDIHFLSVGGSSGFAMLVTGAVTRRKLAPFNIQSMVSTVWAWEQTMTATKRKADIDSWRPFYCVYRWEKSTNALYIYVTFFSHLWCHVFLCLTLDSQILLENKAANSR